MKSVDKNTSHCSYWLRHRVGRQDTRRHKRRAARLTRQVFKRIAKQEQA